MKLVIKFDGDSLSSYQKIHDITRYIKNLSRQNQIVIVCSAISGITDTLIKITDSIKLKNKKKLNQLTKILIQKHMLLANKLITKTTIKNKLIQKLSSNFNEFQSLLSGMIIIGEVTPRSFDHLISFGELFSIDLISYTLLDSYCSSSPLTGKDIGIVTDSNFGDSRLLIDTTELHVSKTISLLLQKRIIPVIAGSSGTDQHGNITTFGRGGSDYTATIIASCIDADEIWINSNNGLMTADSKIVKNPNTIKEISYSEAIEISFFGEKKIHPRTFEPLLSKKIPMRIKNIFDTKNIGTYITNNPNQIQTPIKCITTIRKTSLIDVYGEIMVGTPGTAAKIFSTLAEAGINITMISQNPSESSISIIIKKEELDTAVNSLEINLLGKFIKKINVTSNVAIIALIGSGMRGTTGIASRVFNTIEKKNVNIIMIAQGSSELNLSFVVKDHNCDSVVKALHNEFQL